MSAKLTERREELSAAKGGDGGIVYEECSYFSFISENVGADAHIGPCNIRECLGIRRGDVGIAPYKLNVASS